MQESRLLETKATDVTAVVAHHHRQPTNYSCLSCTYPHIPEEDARERDIAALLGLTIDQVRRGIVDLDTAAELSRNFGEPANTFLGRSMDSLAKARCASGPVTTAGGRQALAPFAFVSSLAGCLMVLDLMRSQSPGRRATVQLFAARSMATSDTGPQTQGKTRSLRVLR